MAQRFLHRLVAVLLLTFICLTSIVFFVIAVFMRVLSEPFDPCLRLLHRFTCLWATLYIWIFPPWSVTIHGRDKIKDDNTYVIVSNHQSGLDILVAFTLFCHFKWVSKAELFNIPFIGWNMFLNRYVRLERGRKNSIIRMYKACENHLEQGSSVFLFPEGTRSLTGHLRQFKEGAFVLAKRMDIPILPLVINGSRDALPKNSLNFHGKTDIHVTVLDTIDPGDYEDLSAIELARLVRKTIQNKLVLPNSDEQEISNQVNPG